MPRQGLVGSKGSVNAEAQGKTGKDDRLSGLNGLAPRAFEGKARCRRSRDQVTTAAVLGEELNRGELRNGKSRGERGH